MVPSQVQRYVSLRGYSLVFFHLLTVSPKRARIFSAFAYHCMLYHLQVNSAWHITVEISMNVFNKKDEWMNEDLKATWGWEIASKLRPEAWDAQLSLGRVSGRKTAPAREEYAWKAWKKKEPDVLWHICLTLPYVKKCDIDVRLSCVSDTLKYAEKVWKKGPAKSYEANHFRELKQNEAMRK